MLEKRIRNAKQKIPEGMLDPKLREDLASGGGLSYPKDNYHITPEELKIIRMQIGAPNIDVKGYDIKVSEEEFPASSGKVTIRKYREADPEEKKVPALIYIHGGGFIGGGPDMCDNLCRGLAGGAHMKVFSIAYGLSPENRFPVPFEQCWEAIRHIDGNAEKEGIKHGLTVMGDSAGGNMAAAAVLRARDENLALFREQILLYPAINIGKLSPGRFAWKESAYDFRDIPEQKKTALDVGVFYDLMKAVYIGKEEDIYNPYACPLMEKDFRNLPRTVIVTGEYDYLRQEDEYYAEKISEAGADVILYRYLGMNHAFLERLGRYEQAESCMDEIVNELSEQNRKNL